MRGGQAIAYVADLREYENIQKMIDFAEEKFGRLDILVNNAESTSFFLQ